MGCWNETCFLTNLPIMEGNRAVFIPLFQKSAIPGEYNPHDNFLYAGTPMVGSYNDYGIIENLDESESAIFTFCLFMDCVEGNEIKIIESCGNSDPINNLNDLIRSLERGRIMPVNMAKLGYPFSANSEFPFRYIMMHEEAYSTVLEEVGNRLPYEKEKPFKIYMREKIEGFKEEFDPKKNIIINLSENSFFRDYFFQEYKWAQAIVDNKASDLVDKLTELALLRVGLNYMRKQLMPTIGKGSQCSEMLLHSRLADFTKKYSNKYKEEILADVSDDELYGDPLAELIML